jgi:hypothetical protein
MWRSRTGTDRVCLICREEFDTFVAAEPEPEPEPERQERHPLVIFRPYEIPQETCGTYLTKIGIMFMILILIGYIIAMSKHVLR